MKRKTKSKRPARFKAGVPGPVRLLITRPVHGDDGFTVVPNFPTERTYRFDTYEEAEAFRAKMLERLTR